MYIKKPSAKYPYGEVVDNDTAHEMEKKAFSLDRESILHVVSALRLYREAAVNLLNKRVRADPVTFAPMAVFDFEHEVLGIESSLVLGEEIIDENDE